MSDVVEAQSEDPIVIAERTLDVLERSDRNSTYKLALMMALLEVLPAIENGTNVPVERLAAKVIELYWPQTVVSPDAGIVLSQLNRKDQTSFVVKEILSFRSETGSAASFLPPGVRGSSEWKGLVEKVEGNLAQWPIAHLQDPADQFLYEFDWTSPPWSLTAYEAGSREIALRPGVLTALVATTPLLKPLLVRMWTDDLIRINAESLNAKPLLRLEDFLFGGSRRDPGPVRKALADLQGGACFFCQSFLGTVHVDHFVPFSLYFNDGLDNLVAACTDCNSSKWSTLAGPEFLQRLLLRNSEDLGLVELAKDSGWPRESETSMRNARTAYLKALDAKPVWLGVGMPTTTVGATRQQFKELLVSGP